MNAYFTTHTIPRPTAGPHSSHFAAITMAKLYVEFEGFSEARLDEYIGDAKLAGKAGGGSGIAKVKEAPAYLCSGWNVLDFAIVVISLIALDETKEDYKLKQARAGAEYESVPPRCCRALHVHAVAM